MIADELCPECHAVPTIVTAAPRRIVKRCSTCTHVWNELPTRPPVEFVGRGGWVQFNDEEWE